jgi:hypothetical protein
MAKDKISQDEIREYELEQDLKILRQSLENIGVAIHEAQYRKIIRIRKKELRQVKKRIKEANKRIKEINKKK